MVYSILFCGAAQKHLEMCQGGFEREFEHDMEQAGYEAAASSSWADGKSLQQRMREHLLRRPRCWGPHQRLRPPHCRSPRCRSPHQRPEVPHQSPRSPHHHLQRHPRRDLYPLLRRPPLPTGCLRRGPHCLHQQQHAQELRHMKTYPWEGCAPVIWIHIAWQRLTVLVWPPTSWYGPKHTQSKPGRNRNCCGPCKGVRQVFLCCRIHA